MIDPNQFLICTLLLTIIISIILSKPLLTMEGTTNVGSDSNHNIYSKLLEEVGIDGRYQTLIIVIFCITTFQMGMMVLGGSYYFAVAPYNNCPHQYPGTLQCTQHVCALPYSERKQYENRQMHSLKTLGNEYGDYHCQKEGEIESAKGVFFFGALIGFTIFSLAADNFGRRRTILVCQVISLVSLLSLFLASNLFWAQVCLFCFGFGLLNFFSLSFCVFGQVLSNIKRQKFEILVQAFNALGGAFSPIAFYIFKDWKIVFALFLVLPLLLCTIVCFIYFEETPQMLIKLYSVAQIRKSFRQIAIINRTEHIFEQSYLLSEAHLQEVKGDYEEEMKDAHKSSFTYIDLFRYPSLRWVTISLTFLFFFSAILYFAPLTIVDEFGFNFYLNGIILNCSQIVTYFFSFSLIVNSQRKSLFSINLLVSLFCTFALIFLTKQEVCTQNCWTTTLVLQLVIFVVFRFAVSLKFQTTFVYTCELYPTQVSALGIGYVNIVMMVPNILLPSFISYLKSHSFPVMMVFCICTVISLVVVSFMGETYGRHPPDVIEEIYQQHKHHHVQLLDEKE